MRGKAFASLFALLAGSALLAGCASAPPQPTVDYKQDYDFGKIRTIAFLPQSGGSSGDSPQAFISDLVSERIDTGIANALKLKGIQVVDDPATADAWISWHLVAQEKTDVRTYNTGPTYGAYYGGYRGYNRMAYYNCWNCGTDVRVRQYTQGTFIVDIIDPQRKQSVWRSVIESRLKGEQPSRDQADYDAAAGRILAAFPPY
jgi:hypothetical protein